MICRTTSFLTAIKIRTTHEGAAKQLIHSLKFERAYAAALPVAEALCQLLPNSFADSHDVVVVPVPTASSRVRARGYDQAAVIAKRVAKQSKLPCQALLRRATQTRQVGASREQRLTQLKTAFYVRKPSFCTGRTILLIDDVLTTGSTFEACAEVLRSAGATRVFGLAFAWQPRK